MKTNSQIKNEDVKKIHPMDNTNNDNNIQH